MNITKDPQAKLDYGLDWSGWLKQRDGTVDAISTASWSISGDDNTLTSSAPYVDSTVTGVWLAGGTAGRTYIVTCHIVTIAGREDDRSLKVQVKQR